jgi:hypothetical protein
VRITTSPINLVPLLVPLCTVIMCFLVPPSAMWITGPSHSICCRYPAWCSLFAIVVIGARGTDLLKPLRALKPQQDNIRIASYLETQANINPYAPVAHFQTDLFLPELTATAIATIATAADNAPPKTRVFIVPFDSEVRRVGHYGTLA